jgi:tetrahydromethanopterin S-methyltransferase subunit B
VDFLVEVDHPEAVSLLKVLNEIESMDELEYFMDDVFGYLGESAPEGYSFGCTEGDGSDFGYWSDASFGF